MPSKVKYPCSILYDGHTSLEGSFLAQPLTEQEAVIMGAVEEFSLSAPLFVAGEVGSTFDVGWSLASFKNLPPWSAVIARTQAGGRGQLRRKWHSPAGNLYVSFFLPDELAKLGGMASLCLGYLVWAALGDMGIHTLLKWPNDLLLAPKNVVLSGQEGKLGGILLEEREGRVLAGLGLNLCHAPDTTLLRDGHAVSAVALSSFAGTVCGFWAELLNGLIYHYTHDIQRTPEKLRQYVEASLAWRGVLVYAEDSGIAGRITGITKDGFLLLETKDGCLQIDSGSIRLVL